MTAELYDNKIFGLGFSALFATQSHALDVAGFVEYDFLTNLAAFDAAIAVWHHKRIFDAVRPATAIKFLYGDAPVTASGGPGSGTVTDLPGRHWQSYLPTADHPEYPSGSTALCHAHAEVSRHYFGSDDLDWTVPTSAGASIIEPGVTPAADLDLHFDTWSDLATRAVQATCGAVSISNRPSPPEPPWGKQWAGAWPPSSTITSPVRRPIPVPHDLAGGGMFTTAARREGPERRPRPPR